MTDADGGGVYHDEPREKKIEVLVIYYALETRAALVQQCRNATIWSAPNASRQKAITRNAIGKPKGIE